MVREVLAAAAQVVVDVSIALIGPSEEARAELLVRRVHVAFGRDRTWTVGRLQQR